MNTLLPANGREKTALYRRASLLALVTIFYNMFEGIVSVFFGIDDETIALAGFGIDSFVEVVSGIGIWHMVRRIRQTSDENPDRFERQALRITGTAFYILAGGLAAASAVNLFTGHKPETTVWGIVIAAVSIVTMWLLIYHKIKVGRELGSQAILADANCTRACMYLSVVLLASSAGYELTGIGGLDSLGAAVIALFALREGKESFDKSRGTAACCCGGSCET